MVGTLTFTDTFFCLERGAVVRRLYRVVCPPQQVHPGAEHRERAGQAVRCDMVVMLPPCCAREKNPGSLRGVVDGVGCPEMRLDERVRAGHGCSDGVAGAHALRRCVRLGA